MLAMFSNHWRVENWRPGGSVGRGTGVGASDGDGAGVGRRVGRGVGRADSPGNCVGAAVSSGGEVGVSTGIEIPLNIDPALRPTTTTRAAATTGLQFNGRRDASTETAIPAPAARIAPRLAAPVAKTAQVSGSATTKRATVARSAPMSPGARTRSATAATEWTAMSPALKKTRGVLEPGRVSSMPACEAVKIARQIGSHSAKTGTMAA